MSLLHLTFIGPSVSPATVEFGPKLTLVRGPSDTGKSYIAEAIDFMLGGKGLNKISELDGYDAVLLAIRLPGDENITLSRSIQGGGFHLFRGDHRAYPLPVERESLSAKHSAKNFKNLSHYLLGKIGLDGKVVRKDGAGKTKTLSLRILAPLFLVDETKIQSKIAPVLTGQHTLRTSEISTFRLLLQGEDDSAIEPRETKTEQRRSKVAKHEVIDTLLAELRQQLQTDETLQAATGRLGRLQETISNSAGAIEEIAAARQQWGHALSNSERLVTAARRSLSELDTLDARFTLLHAQYSSDLARLEAVAEAGSLLGYFAPGSCAFCGAEPEHQHLNEDCADDTTAFAESVREEQRKTTMLREDLVQAIAGLRTDRADKARRLQNYTDRATQARSQIVELDRVLDPQQSELRELISSSSQLEKDVETIRRIRRLEALRAEVDAEPKPDAMEPTAGLQRSAVDDLSRMIADRLRAWGFPDADTTSYGFDDQDIVSGRQLRSAHGKGVRAVLHAAFTISLAQYCFDNDRPHPGFVVLDSPLVVYRPPDPDAEPDDSGDVLDTTSLAGRFFADVQSNFSGQIIIMENEDPPDALDAGSRDISFTKNPDRGRYGLFPIGQETRDGI
ncbi:AAA family ATPase [Actinosynnema pretiosum subsp. pretiosum]|uniref:AAA family ATPase n=1 Tax=Actinosynnema pretiosum subsp. pretiosum TaxID=103721 RepID=A0AA45R3Y7_9PSEU|nr:ATPase involved in DNA repair [Actinosynnema pretiosum subsp. pretiosum]QUF04068.1 AAA family ATPase [Actinosynnema pretiosum subsp. pretiosum]